MKLKLIPLLLMPALMLLVACGGATEPTPDIDAMVEARVREGLLSSNVSEWMSLGQTEAEAALQGARHPDTTQAFFVILGYSVALVIVSLWLFQRRDVSGSRGE